MSKLIGQGAPEINIIGQYFTQDEEDKYNEAYVKYSSALESYLSIKNQGDKANIENVFSVVNSCENELILILKKKQKMFDNENNIELNHDSIRNQFFSDIIMQLNFFSRIRNDEYAKLQGKYRNTSYYAQAFGDLYFFLKKAFKSDGKMQKQLLDLVYEENFIDLKKELTQGDYKEFLEAYCQPQEHETLNYLLDYFIQSTSHRQSGKNDILE